MLTQVLHGAVRTEVTVHDYCTSYNLEHTECRAQMSWKQLQSSWLETEPIYFKDTYTAPIIVVPERHTIFRTLILTNTLVR